MNCRLFFLAAIVALLVLPFGSQAQNSTDALRYSYFNVGGSGRFVGTGGSLSALGTEFSVLSTNPAGLALYRSSEVVLSGGVPITTGKSTLEGSFFPKEDSYLPQDLESEPFSKTRTAFNLSNLGFVVHSEPRNLAFKTMNFGIGINQLGSFHQEFFYEGETIGSIAERWQELANNFGENDFEAGPAIDAQALYDIDNNGDYQTDYELTYDNEFVGAPLLRNQTARSRGSISELVFALATNYQERVMIGLTIGVPFINYRQTKTYTEIDNGDGAEGNVPFFDQLTFEETLTTTGAGVNAKLGVIFRPLQAFRLGFAIHTPTSLSLDDEYDLAITYDYTDADGSFSNYGESDEGIFDYRLRTPWRMFGSAGLLFNNIGFLSAEVEWADYGRSSFRFNNFPQQQADANDDIAQTLDQVLNIRVGGEAALDIFRFRAGVGLLQSPYSDAGDTNLSLSAGLGIRTNSFFIDAAWRNRSQTYGYIPYNSIDVPQQFVNNKFNYHDFILTLGFRY